MLKRKLSGEDSSVRNFWQGFEKRADDSVDKSNKWSTGKKLLAGGALLGAGIVGGIAGARGYAAKLRQLNERGGSTWGRFDKMVFGHDRAKPRSFLSYYQGDTRYSHGGVFDHLKKEDISDTLPDWGAKVYHKGQGVRMKGTYSPAHDAHLIKNKDGSWSSHHATHHKAKPEARDKRLHFMSTVIDWDKKPSPEAIAQARYKVIDEQAGAKYV